MKKLSNTEIFYGLIRNDMEAIAEIAGLTIPELIKKVKYLRTDCVEKGGADPAIANVSFKKQLAKYRHEAVRKTVDYKTTFNDDTILKRCLGDVFSVEVIWLCLESRIKAHILKIYLKFRNFREKRELWADNIFRLISLDAMEVLKQKLVTQPRRKHSNGLLYIICRNKIADYINQGINEVETNDESILTTTAGRPRDINWETICIDFLEKILTRTEFEGYMRKTNEKYEILADALQHKAGLSSNERKILLFKLVSGETHGEISIILGLDPDTSKTLLSRALGKIRAYLRENKIGLKY